MFILHNNNQFNLMGTTFKLKSGTNVLSDLGGKCRHTTVKSSKYNINHRKDIKDKAECNIPSGFSFREVVQAANYVTSNLKHRITEG